MNIVNLHLDRGNYLFNNYKYEKAIDHYNDAYDMLNANPFYDSSLDKIKLDILYNIVKCNYYLNRFDIIIQILNQMELESLSTEIIHLLIIAYKGLELDREEYKCLKYLYLYRQDELNDIKVDEIMELLYKYNMNIGDYEEILELKIYKNDYEKHMLLVKLCRYYYNKNEEDEIRILLFKYLTIEKCNNINLINIINDNNYYLSTSELYASYKYAKLKYYNDINNINNITYLSYICNKLKSYKKVVKYHKILYSYERITKDTLLRSKVLMYFEDKQYRKVRDIIYKIKSINVHDNLLIALSYFCEDRLNSMNQYIIRAKKINPTKVVQTCYSLCKIFNIKGASSLLHHLRKKHKL